MPPPSEPIPVEGISLPDHLIALFYSCPECGESVFGIYLGKDGKIYLACDNCETRSGFANEDILVYAMTDVHQSLKLEAAGDQLPLPSVTPEPT